MLLSEGRRSELVREDGSSDNAFSENTCSFANKFAPTAYGLRPESKADLCITISTPRGSAFRDAERHPMHANAEHWHDSQNPHDDGHPHKKRRCPQQRTAPFSQVPVRHWTTLIPPGFCSPLHTHPPTACRRRGCVPARLSSAPDGRCHICASGSVVPIDEKRSAGSARSAR